MLLTQQLLQEKNVVHSYKYRAVQQDMLFLCRMKPLQFLCFILRIQPSTCASTIFYDDLLFLNLLHPRKCQSFLERANCFQSGQRAFKAVLSKDRNVRVLYKYSPGTGKNPLCPSTQLFPLLFASTNHDQSDTDTQKPLPKMGLSDSCCSCVTFF